MSLRNKDWLVGGEPLHARLRGKVGKKVEGRIQYS